MSVKRVLRAIPNNIKLAMILLLIIVVSGTFGYHILEDKNLFTSFYWTIITITTLGSGDVFPLTDQGKFFSIIIIISGVSMVLYTFTTVMTFYFEGRLKTIMGVSRMEDKIGQMKGHCIVCGYGKVGKNVVARLMEDNVPFVVVEKDPSISETLLSDDILHITGDATYGDILEKAGLKRGKVLISCLADDADTLYAIVEAKELNKDINIIAKASRPESVMRFRKFGADKVIMPEVAEANQMAKQAKMYMDQKAE